MPQKTKSEERRIEEMEVVSQETPATKEEPMVKMSDVKRLVAEALQNAEVEKREMMKPKRVTEHTAHAWRFDGKWVSGFKDRNTDPYIKVPVYTYKKYNDQTREFVTWIELMFPDGTTKEIAHTTYMQNRSPVYCPIIKRHQKDISYVTGEVEKKKEVNDKLVGTGVMIDQEVRMIEEIIEIRTPDGEILMLSSDVMA